MSDQGPATPGTAARCEVCGWARGYGKGLCYAHVPDYYDYEISACFRRGYERLKAENASLGRDLADSRQGRKQAEQRNTALTGLLREALAGFQWGGNAKALDFAVRARAALNDEERRPRDYDPITAPIPEGDMNGPHGPLHTPDDEERSAPPQEGEK